jgi:hypothetical protein
MSEGRGEIWTLAQTKIWVCNVLGRFRSPGEIRQFIDTFRYRPPKRERTMTEAFMQLLFVLHPLPSIPNDENVPGADDEPVKRTNIDLDRSLSIVWGKAGEEITAAVGNGSASLFGPPRDGTRIEKISRLDCRQIQFKENGDQGAYADARAPLPCWDMIRFEAAEVTSLWPHADEGPKVEIMRTGTAGRPTGKQVVLIEAQRRRESGEVLPSVKKESEVLAEWYTEGYPDGPTMKPGTIENTIRGGHNSFWASSLSDSTPGLRLR